MTEHSFEEVARIGLLCTALIGPGRGRICRCESDPALPSATPHMSPHGDAACACHPEHATANGVTPFRCVTPPGASA